MLLRNHTCNLPYILELAMGTFWFTIRYNTTTNNLLQDCNTVKHHRGMKDMHINNKWILLPSRWHKWNTDTSKMELRCSTPNSYVCREDTWRIIRKLAYPNGDCSVLVAETLDVKEAIRTVIRCGIPRSLWNVILK